jgi:membrane fusion protein, heavy metal efflux system
VISRSGAMAALSALGIAATAAGFIACSSREDKADSKAIVTRGASDSTARPLTLSDSQRARITIEPAVVTRYRPILEATGNVSFNLDESTPVLSPISGPVTRIVRFAGARVHAGDVLATVSSPDFATAVADYRKADAGWRNTKQIADLDEQLFKNDALARRDLDQARTDLASATADLEAATQQLRALGVGDSTIAAIREGRQLTPVEGAIRTPLSGTVVEQLVSPGQLLQAGTTQAFTVANLSSMWVMANVFESDLSVVQAGETVEIITPASPRPIGGRVDYVGALVDPGTRATSVRILAQNPGEILKRDMFVEVRIHANRERSGILLPTSAVLKDDNSLPFVYLEQADKSFVRRRVTLGGRIGDRWEIAAGLTAGERVVQNGGLFLQFAESQ